MKNKGRYQTKEMMFSSVRVEGLTLALGADGALPKRIKVLNWGENPNCHGQRVCVGSQLVLAMSSGVYPFKRVALDFEHNTFPGSRAYMESSEPRKVAGFGAVEVVEGDGVYLCIDKWTPEGLAYGVNYCDVSAVPAMDKHGNVIAVKSVALCRNGAVPEMEFRDVALGVDVAFADQVGTNSNKETHMDKLRAFIAKLLGKDPETITEEEMVQGLEGKLNAPADAPNGEPLSADALGELFDRKLQEALAPVQETVTALSASYKALDAASVAAKKQGIVDEALRCGKQVALNADAISALSVEQLEAHVAALSVTVPVDQRTAKVVPESGAVPKVSEFQRSLALSCNVDPDEVFGSK